MLPKRFPKKSLSIYSLISSILQFNFPHILIRIWHCFFFIAFIRSFVSFQYLYLYVPLVPERSVFKSPTMIMDSCICPCSSAKIYIIFSDHVIQCNRRITPLFAWWVGPVVIIKHPSLLIATLVFFCVFCFICFCLKCLTFWNKQGIQAYLDEHFWDVGFSTL